MPSLCRTKRRSTGFCFRPAPKHCKTIAGDPKHLRAEIGFFSILHTWGQNLLHHPQVHCVVTGGGLSADKKTWIACLPGFFLSVPSKESGVSRQSQRPAECLPQLLDQLGNIEWVVYAKPPFGGPQQVLAT